MTDPSLYSFSDDFYQQLFNAQQQQQYYSQPYQDSYDQDGQDSEDSGDSDYEDKYNDLSDKYDTLLNSLQQLKDQISNQQYTPSLDYSNSDDPNYVSDFIYNNVLGVDRYSKKGFQTFNTYQEGKDALINQLKLYQTGKTRNPVGPNSSLLEAMNVYAPSSDNNDPTGYADFIANQLGVSPDTPISKIDTNKWADAIEKREGNKYGNNPGNLRKYRVGGITYDIPDQFNFPL